jgi:hypothetical protein
MSWAKSDMLALPPDLAQKTREEIMESPSPAWWAEFFQVWGAVFFLFFLVIF